MATTATTEESLTTYRVAMMEELGFSTEDSLKLVEATKAIPNVEGNRTYWYDVPVTWHDVDKLLKAGATHEQVMRILGP